MSEQITEAKKLVASAHTKYDTGDYNGAIQELDKAIVLNPADAIAWHDRAVAKHKMGNLQGALADYREAIELNSAYKDELEPLIIEIEKKLATSRKPAYVTRTLLGINIFLFVAMVVSGVSLMSPTTKDLLKWGADFGPYTVNGEWWRLLVSAFMHVGIIHLAMNMLCLFQAGRVAEYLFGKVDFLILYILSAIGGSLASVICHPIFIAAGASGAIFGIYGGLTSFLLLRKNVLPPATVQRLGKGATSFIVYNLLFGFASAGIDNIAHIGGLVAGFVAGVCLLKKLSPASGKSILRQYWLIGTVAGLLVIITFTAFARISTISDVASYAARLYINQGNEKYELGDYKGTLEDYSKAISIDQNNALAYVGRGAAKENLGDYKGFLEDCSKAISIDPNNADAYLNRGLAKGAKGDNKGWLEDCSKAISIDQNNAGAYLNRGFAKYWLEDYAGAIADWENAISLAPANKEKLQPFIDDARKKLEGGKEK